MSSRGETPPREPYELGAGSKFALVVGVDLACAVVLALVAFAVILLKP